MRITRKQTDNPRSRRKVRYSITELTAAEFESICNALGLVKETDQTAAALYKSFSELASAADEAETVKASVELDDKVERLKRLIDD